MSRLTHALSLPLQWASALHRPARHPLPRPTISVGNLALGGRAKTPLVAALARLAQLDGHHPVILLRGYPRVSETQPPIALQVQSLVSSSNLPASWLRLLRRGEDSDHVAPAYAHAPAAGDEAPWLAATAGCPVVAHPNRFEAAAVALRGWPETSLFLLDDGLQGRVEAEIEIVVVDPERDLDHRAALRTSPGALTPKHRVVHLGRDLHRRAHSLRDLRTGETQDANCVSDRLTLTAAVADPASVRDLAQAVGLDVEATMTLRDHRGPSKRRLRATSGCLLMTEKDAVGWGMASGRRGLVLELRLDGVEAVYAELAPLLNR